MCVALAEIARVSISDSASSATPSTGAGGREQKEGEISRVTSTGKSVL